MAVMAILAISVLIRVNSRNSWPMLFSWAWLADLQNYPLTKLPIYQILLARRHGHQFRPGRTNQLIAFIEHLGLAKADCLACLDALSLGPEDSLRQRFQVRDPQVNGGRVGLRIKSRDRSHSASRIHNGSQNASM